MPEFAYTIATYGVLCCIVEGYTSWLKIYA